MRQIVWAQVLGWVCGGLLALGAAQAQSYGSDLDAALASASPRLKLFALMQARPQGGAALADALQRHLALRHIAQAGPQGIGASLTLAPIAEYDSNINGGTPGERLTIGGLAFTLTPASRAKAGMVAGANLAAQLRLSLGLGRLVEISASAGAARALDYDLSRSHYSLGICGAQYMGQADWLDLCASRKGSARALSTAREDAISLGFARQFNAARGYGEATMRASRTDFGTFAKTALDFGLSRATARFGLVEGRLEWGQPVAGQHTRLWGASLSVTRPMFGVQSTAFLNAAREGGADFFGTARFDDVIGIGMTRPLGDKMSVTLSAARRMSTLENYSGTSFGLNFTFAGLQF